MPGFARSSLAAYGLAVLSVLAAALARYLLEPVLHDRLPFITYFVALMLAAWYGGRGPAFLAVVLGAILAGYFAVEPRGTLQLNGIDFQVGLGLFVFTGVIIGMLCESLHEARRLLERQSAALAEERERLKVTVRSIGDAVIVTNPLGEVTFLNVVAENLTGWPLDDARGQPLEKVFRIINETTRATVDSPVAKVLREGVIVGLANHTLLIARDGVERPIDDSAAPIRDASGNLFGVVLVFRDISERKKIESSLVHWAAIVESSDDGILSKSLDGTITSWNRGAERLYGYTAEEVVGKSITVIIPPDLQSEAFKIIDIVKQGQHVQALETVRRRKDGQLIDVSLTVSPIKSLEGELQGVSVIARDVSDRKRTDKLLRTSEERLRFLAEASVTLSSLVDYQSTMQKVTRLAVPYFADWCTVYLIDEETRLKRVAMAHRDPDQERLLEEFDRTLPLDWSSPTPVIPVLRDGKSDYRAEISDEYLDSISGGDEQMGLLRQLHPRSHIIVPLRSRGFTIGALGFVITEPGRHYEPIDLALAEDIARRAAVAIENARLYREIRDADRRKDEFLAMLAHELRNPLAPIRNALSLLALENVDAETGKWAREVMERQVDQLVRLVDDLLDVSRIMRGKIELRMEAIELAAIVARAVETARPVIDAQEHQLTIQLPDEPIWIDADPVRLAQVLANLLNNAAKYTEHGGRIELTAGRERSGAVIRVRDNGVGIAPDVLPRIFDLFTQADRSIERSQGGLGIGLTLVRSLVDLHGGSVSAESAGPGKGSQFTIRLPAHHTEPDKSPAPTEPVVGPKLRVLIVDDNVGAAVVLSKLLNSLWHHEVRLAHDGLDAIAQARLFLPDLVLLDIGLPGISGYDVARRLRDDPSLAGTFVVALTGYGQEDDRRRSKEAGFDEHLTKPVSIPLLEGVFTRMRRERAAES